MMAESEGLSYAVSGEGELERWQKLTEFEADPDVSGQNARRGSFAFSDMQTRCM